MSDKKRDGHAPGKDEEERIGDETELDDLDDEEFEPSACPVCREDCCSEHLVAATCCDDADVRGAIDGVSKSGISPRAPWMTNKHRFKALGRRCRHEKTTSSCIRREGCSLRPARAARRAPHRTPHTSHLAPRTSHLAPRIQSCRCIHATHTQRAGTLTTPSLDALKLMQKAIKYK